MLIAFAQWHLPKKRKKSATICSTALLLEVEIIIGANKLTKDLEGKARE